MASLSSQQFHAARFPAPDVEWLLVWWCNLELNVLLYRLVIQHGHTGHDASTDYNARDGSETISISGLRLLASRLPLALFSSRRSIALADRPMFTPYSPRRGLTR